MVTKYFIIGIPVLIFVTVSILSTIFKETLSKVPVLGNPIVLTLLASSGIAAIIAAAMQLFDTLQRNTVKLALGFIKNEVLQGWIIKFIFVMFLFLVGALGYGSLIPRPFEGNATLV